MKRIIYLGTLLLGIMCLVSCSSKPKDARVVVKQFLQCIKDGDSKKLAKLSQDSNLQSFIKDYNPNWEPKDVVLSESVDTINEGSGKTFIVSAQYKDKKASFYVGKQDDDYFISDFYNFLTIDTTIFKSEKGFVVKRACTDRKLLHAMQNDVEKIADCVNNFNKSIIDGKILFQLYPKSSSFENYIITDSIIPKIRSIFILNNMGAKVECEDGKIFVLDDTYTIIDSKGVYDFHRKIADLCAEYNYRSYLAPPKTDLEAVEVVNVERERIKEEVQRIKEEAERKAHYKERAEYYRKVGLVIDYLRFARGKDKDGDPATGFQIKFFNPTSKTIKYIVIYTTALNGVNDAMGRKTARGIGPIEPGDGGTYDFSNLFYDRNGIIQDVSVRIELTYTDGSRKSVKWKDAMASQDGFDNVREWVSNEFFN